MLDRRIKKAIYALSCAAVTALFIVLLFFCAPHISAVPRTSGSVVYPYAKREDGAVVSVDRITAEVGKDLTAVRISDLGRLKKITEVNYVPDEFVTTGMLSPNIQIVDLTKPFRFAEKGTLIFVILNLDPFASDFGEQSQRLSEYKIGDFWHFTLSLPEIFCASNVYRKTSLIARNGEIENYDFIEYTTSYDVKTDRFSAQTENTLISLDFYTRRTTMEDAFNAGHVVTVHYQSTGGAYSGIADAPLIGTEDAVKNVNGHSDDLVVAVAILALVVFAVFVVMSLLKHTKEFIPPAVWVFGIALLLVSRYFLAQTTGTPLVWVAFWLASSFAVAGGALLALGRNFGKIPAKYIFPALAVLGALLAFVCPFASFDAANGLKIACIVVKSVCVVALIGFIALSVFDKGDDGILKTLCAVIIAVALGASLFMPQIFPAQINPIFWLCVLTVITTFVSVFIVFKETEKANEYLTANLHKEVERQVKDIRAVIGERDKLLQFVSHDMKKPLASAVTLSDTAIEREKDDEQIKTMQIIKQSCMRVINNLSEIAAYAKFNYLAEPSQVADLCELCALLFKYHELDCNANGMVLKNTVKSHVKAFVKRQGLENVLSNLIINAVEHSDCKTVTLSVKSEKNKVVLCVADDGKGIPGDIDVFKPYVSEDDSETSGVGLYICKNIIESMNGTLTYQSDDRGTAFYISLLKA